MIDALVLVEAAMTFALSQAWRRSGYVERIAALGGAVAVLTDDPQATWPEGWKPVTHLSQALDAFPHVQAVIHVEAEQIFMDVGVALGGLAKFADHRPDLFTQWEHCLLPVGVGVRIYSPQCLRRAGKERMSEILTTVLAAPSVFTVRYDEREYVDVNAHLLDSRFSDHTAAAVAQATSWSLAGYLAVADARCHRYAGDSGNKVTDRRGMAAPYGFESRECADFPTYVMFDLTNRCNAACVHCPQSIGFTGQDKPSFLDFDVFKQAIDECVGRPIQFVRITADGEPLLHPRVWDMLDYATMKGVGPVGLTTNGAALNAANARRLLASGTFMVDISIDAASEATFQEVRVGLSYSQVRDNVLRLLDLRQDTGSKLKVMTSFVRQPANAHEVNDFHAQWTPLVDKVLIRELNSNVGLNDVAAAAEVPAGGRWPCPHFWRRVVIGYGGEVKACPIDWQGGLVDRPLAVSPIHAQWRDSFYHDHRMQHLNNDFRADSICRDCRDWQASPWDLGYEKVIRDLREREG
ncbi:MAG: radical SAM/SPASM domain-containing protein [Magnetospirillum sp.]